MQSSDLTDEERAAVEFIALAPPSAKFDTARREHLAQTYRQVVHDWQYLPQKRVSLARYWAEVVNRSQGLSLPVPAPDHSSLAQIGHYPLGQLLSTSHVADVLAHIKDKDCYAWHAYNGSEPKRYEELSQTSVYAAYRQPDIARAPHLLELANNREILSLVHDYFGCAPTLYSLNLWWTFPQKSGKAFTEGQDLHRDLAHCRFCVLFVYLTDIEGEAGAHIFIPTTHHKEGVETLLRAQGNPANADSFFDGAGYNVTHDIRSTFGGKAMHINGPSGKAFLEDTYGFHGSVPPDKPRLLFWARWAIGPNFVQFRDTESIPAAVLEERIPLDPYLHYVNRWVFCDTPESVPPK